MSIIDFAKATMKAKAKEESSKGKVDNNTASIVMCLTGDEDSPTKVYSAIGVKAIVDLMQQTKNDGVTPVAACLVGYSLKDGWKVLSGHSFLPDDILKEAQEDD